MSLPEYAIRARLASLTTHRLARFIAVGTVNTAVDLAIYTGLVLLGVGVVPANLVSTTCGLVVSFLLNRSFVFRATRSARWTSKLRQLGLFLLTTGFGLWVLQPLVIVAVSALLAPASPVTAVAIVVPKLAATCVTLVWNYALYSLVVFARSTEPASTAER